MRRVLAERVSAGQLRPGQRLGAERALATELGVSRATLRNALAVPRYHTKVIALMALERAWVRGGAPPEELAKPSVPSSSDGPR